MSQLPRSRTTSGLWATRMQASLRETGDHDLPSRVEDRPAAVAEKGEACALHDLRTPGSGDPVPVVVVAPDDELAVTRAQRAEKRSELLPVIVPADEVARDDDDVRVGVVDDLDRPPLAIPQ